MCVWVCKTGTGREQNEMISAPPPLLHPPIPHHSIASGNAVHADRFSLSSFARTDVARRSLDVLYNYIYKFHTKKKNINVE